MTLDYIWGFLRKSKSTNYTINKCFSRSNERDWPQARYATKFCFLSLMQKTIYNVKPGLSGIGSIIFRDEEQIITDKNKHDIWHFYKNKIYPFKGKLEI